MSRVPAALNYTEEDIQLLLAAKAHFGTTNVDSHMTPYVYTRRADGVHLINLGKTMEKLVLAARIIAAIENPADVCVISARPFGQRAVLKYGTNTGAKAIAGRFTPGNFTNYITRQFKEPRLIIVADSRADHQAIREASYVNIPVIAFCNTDSPLTNVDCAIPINNASKHALGLGFWLLAREVLRLRGTLSRDEAWNVMTDMFFFRDPEEVEKEQEAAAEKAADNGPWDGEVATESGEWNGGAPGAPDVAALAAVATGTDWAADGTVEGAAAGQGWDA